MTNFKFNEDFNTIKGEKITLKIIEKLNRSDEETPMYWYDIIENKTNKTVGKISIRIGQTYNSYYEGNIGYEVDEKYQGNKYSLAACKLVLKIAKHHQMDYVYITCNNDNYASKNIIETLGGNFIEEIEVPKDYIYYFEGIKPHCIYKINL